MSLAARCAAADVVTLGNLCVDVALDVQRLPPAAPREARLRYLRTLEARPPEQARWEAGGICNFGIAAARLGLHCTSIGHVGHEEEGYGAFLRRVMDEQGVHLLTYTDGDCHSSSSSSSPTLVCWVLLHPASGGHDFCSRYDFMDGPALAGVVNGLPLPAAATISAGGALFLNGFVFDELPPHVITAAADAACAAGKPLFFDPGPRAPHLLRCGGATTAALRHLLARSHVLLLTADEAAALTGGDDDPHSAGRRLLAGTAAAEERWVIVKLGAGGALLLLQTDREEEVHEVAGHSVEVRDTVGCGDSFGAAVVMGRLRGLPAAATLALANAVGAATAMSTGAGRQVATVTNVRRLLASRPSDPASLLALRHLSVSDEPL